jgi:hypothetical protein
MMVMNGPIIENLAFEGRHASQMNSLQLISRLFLKISETQTAHGFFSDRIS